MSGSGLDKLLVIQNSPLECSQVGRLEHIASIFYLIPAQEVNLSRGTCRRIVYHMGQNTQIVDLNHQNWYP